MNAMAELPKLCAFVRRDVRIAMSYRMGMAGGLLGVLAQIVAFSFLGKLVDPSRLPLFGGTRTSYIEFVAIGICLNMAVMLLVHELARALRNEQMMGTLESLLITPTRVLTIQIGSTLFSLLYVPLRMCLFLAVIAVLFGLHLHGAGVLPSIVLLLEFLPFLWGLGLVAAGIMLTARRGAGAIGTGVALLGLGSGVFFPLSVLPTWLREVATVNPIAITLDALRDALIGGAGWHTLAGPMLELLPVAIVSAGLGVYCFQRFLRRERRLGTLGLY